MALNFPQNGIVFYEKERIIGSVEETDLVPKK